MRGLRQRLVEPDARNDIELASHRGLLAGIFQAGNSVVAFGALFLLAVSPDVVSPDAVAAAPAVVSWAALLGGGAVGADMVALVTVEPAHRFWRRPVGRLVTVLAVYLDFFGLVATVPGPAVAPGWGTWLAGSRPTPASSRRPAEPPAQIRPTVT